jgi:hypothetical protein
VGGRRYDRYAATSGGISRTLTKAGRLGVRLLLVKVKLRRPSNPYALSEGSASCGAAWLSYGLYSHRRSIDLLRRSCIPPWSRYGVRGDRDAGAVARLHVPPTGLPAASTSTRFVLEARLTLWQVANLDHDESSGRMNCTRPVGLERPMKRVLIRYSPDQTQSQSSHPEIRYICLAQWY